MALLWPDTVVIIIIIVVVREGAMSRTIEFLLPEAIKNFVFDLHEACRLSLRIEDVHR